ncbi:hypothetical protein CCACVL1_07965 [Corchorus capsularis]|uniref:Integrase, catalytic core n=1 Tax=Corchorus capsularis TaxID=210143 RepID=A0A1R3J342_COCAP|nr:hypothetical protein CCACVL1_07965 [Corchorus capsularis]
MTSSNSAPIYSYPSTLNVGNFVSLKLTSKNFLLWKTQMLGLIESQDMLGFINGATPMPKSHVSKDEDAKQEKENPDFVAWRRSDRLLRGWITSTLSEEALGLVVGLETSAEVWKALVDSFAQDTQEREISLQLQLQNHTKDGHSMADYIRIFKNVCDDLAAIGKPADDRAKVFGLLRGLGSDYESFITSMLKPPIPTSNDLIPLLQGHEIMKSLHQTSKSPNLNMAFMSQRNTANRNFSKRGRGSFSSRGRGFPQTYNNRFNRNDGYSGSNSNGSSTHGNNSQDDSGKTNIVCKICKLPKHTALDCYNRFNHAYQSEKARQAMAAMKLDGPIDNSWFPDTAASAHMTADPGILSSLSQYHGCDKILIGDGSLLDISHTGTMDIPVLDGNLQLNNVLVVPEIKKNLLSVGQLTDDYPYTCEFSSAGVVIKDRETGKMIAKGNLFNFCKNNGIKLQYACPKTPEQNGLVERKHRNIVELGLTLLFHSHTPKRELHKGYRCLHPPSGRVYISRHVTFDEKVFPFKDPGSLFAPSDTCDLTEFIDWFSGSPADEDTLGKPTTSTPLHVSETQSLEDVSLGASSFPDVSCATTPSHSSTPESATDVTLINEEVHNPDPSIPMNHVQQEEVVINSEPQVPSTNSSPIATRQSHGIAKPNPKYFNDDFCFTATSIPIEPKSVKTALKHPDWKAAMEEEIHALMQNDTWELVPPSNSMNIVGCKWVFKTKTKADGSLERLKARLVAKGFNQVPGVDFLETFSPVVKPATIRVVLTIALARDWEIRQLDVKNAFLHGFLNEPVFMTQPPGFQNSQHPNYVCKLNKALYGLRQAPRAWFDRFSTFLLSFGFTCSVADSSLFVLQSSRGTILLLLYVDDIILTGSNSHFLRDFIAALGREFSMKDLGPLHYFLGVSVTPFDGGILLHQAQYARELLDRALMHNCKPISTPMATKSGSSPNDDALYSDAPFYRSIVGGLQYLTFTRPDICYSVNYLCQFMHQPTNLHFRLVKRLLRYVQGTIDYGIRLLRHQPLELCGFSDADWAGCSLTRRSTTGYCTYLGGNCISWSAKKQPTVARSSTEAEYRALASAAAEMTWLSFVLRDIGVYLKKPPVLFSDNISALHMTINPVFHARTKHIEIDYHFVREKVSAGSLVTQFVSSSNQVADVFTKALPRHALLLLRVKLGLCQIPQPSLRGRDETPDFVAMSNTNRLHLDYRSNGDKLTFD